MVYSSLPREGRGGWTPDNRKLAYLRPKFTPGPTLSLLEWGLAFIICFASDYCM